MNRNPWGLDFAFLLALAVFLGGLAPAWMAPETQSVPERKAPHPSVVLITLDTVRRDRIRCYGYPRIETPAIDRLAAEGIRFESAYAQVPITLPSHTVILTGTYPMFNGVRDFTSAGLPENIPTLAEILRRHGYQTAAFVSSFVLNSMWGLNRGFDLYDDNLGFDTARVKNPLRLERRGDQTVGRMLAWLTNRKAPFFVWLHLYDAHSPYRPPEPFLSTYSASPYDGEIAFNDSQVARVIARLKTLALYENSLIVLTSDHGESLGEHGEDEHGFFVYNATVCVPLILKLPEPATRGQIFARPVGTVDIAPTIAQVCRIPAAEARSFQGRSLLSATEEARASEDRPVYVESYYPRNSFGWRDLRSVVTSKFKYIEAPRAELYDLGRDPAEQTNILAANSAVAASLRDQLLDFDRRFHGSEASASPPLDPETLEKLKSLGYVAYESKTDNLSDAQRADPKDKIAILNRILKASDLTRLGRFAEADQVLARLAPAEPNLYIIPFSKGENYLAWQKPQRALAEFRRALALNPTFDQAALGLGRAYFLLGQDAGAASALELALRLSPRNFLARVALAKVYWRENQLGKAARELVEVVRSHPQFPEARADYGIILAKQGKYREALQEIERGMKLGYRDATAYNYLGITFSQLGDPAKAIAAYERAVALNPRYAAAYINLALQYRRQGQGEKALSYYRRACDLSDELCRQYASQFK